MNRPQAVRTAGLVTLLLAFGAAGARAQGSGCVAAHCVPPANLITSGRIFGGFSNGDYQPGQTFSPLFRGVLREVRLALHSTTPGDTARVIAEIRLVSGGLPTAAVFARALVSGAPYVAGPLYPASFEGHNLVLDPGTRYAITLRGGGSQVVYALAAFPGCDPSTGSYDPVHTYDGGLTWGYAWSPRERSFVYQVCLDAATPTTRSTWGRVKLLYR